MLSTKRNKEQQKECQFEQRLPNLHTHTTRPPARSSTFADERAMSSEPGLKAFWMPCSTEEGSVSLNSRAWEECVVVYRGARVRTCKKQHVCATVRKRVRKREKERVCARVHAVQH